MTDADDTTARGRALLAEIADVTGCPVEAFYDEALLPVAVCQSREMLRAFDRLCESDRVHLIAYARQLASGCAH